jgi:lipoate-protein ligase A
MQSGGWTFLDTGEGRGSFNMELDERLARRLADGSGEPVLRLFRWKPWAISVGYHQPTGDLDLKRCTADGIDVVRRPTGGRAILHAEELTYSLVMHAGRRSILEVYNSIASALVCGLDLYGVAVSLQKSQPDFAKEYRAPASLPCFSSSARYEIEWQGRKLVGSAQRRFSEGSGDVVLQHGSILCGPAHRRLADYVTFGEATRGMIKRDLEGRTTDLGLICGTQVDYQRLSECIRRGFEISWGVSFRLPQEGAEQYLLTTTT